MKGRPCVGVFVALLVACGGSGGGLLTNPTSGELPTYPSIEALTAAAVPGCDWTIDRPGDPSAETEARCEEKDLWVQWIPGDEVTAAEDLTEGTYSTEERCEHYAGRPFVIGGNWWAVLRDDEQAVALVKTLGGYLFPAVDCGETTGAPSPSEDPVLIQPVVDWSRRFPGDIYDASGTSDGGAVIVGSRVRCDSAVCWDTALVVRYGTDGSLVWRDAWPVGGHGRWSQARGVAVDADGNIYVVGSAFFTEGASGFGVMVLRKYSSNGERLWTWSTRPRRDWFDPDARPIERGLDVTVTATAKMERVTVAGERSRRGDPETVDGWVRAFDADGAVAWTSPFEAPAYPRTRDGTTEIDSLAFHGRVWAYAAGWVATQPGPWQDRDLMVQEIRQNGQASWTRVVADDARSRNDRDEATGLVVARGGGVLVSAALNRGKPSSHGWLALLMTRRGEIRWQVRWPRDSQVSAVASTRNGMLYATGERVQTGHQAHLLRAYWPEGDELWRVARRDPKGSGTAVAAADGAIYVGARRGGATGGPRSVVLHYVEP